MSNRHLEKFETIVIDYGSRKSRWIGSWRQFKITNPNSKVHNVETLESYKKRLKPLNNANKGI